MEINLAEYKKESFSNCEIKGPAGDALDSPDSIILQIDLNAG